MLDILNPEFLNLFNVIIIRYQEIAIKSDKVRKRLIDRLIKNIKFHLQKNQINNFEISYDWGFIYLKIEKTYYNKVIIILLKILGIYSISLAIETDIEFNIIISTIVQFAKSIIHNNQTFGIKSRKVGQHPFSSQDIAIKAGSEILNQLNPTRSIRVDLDHPDHLIEVVVREKKTYIFNKILPTYWGGNPIDLPRGCISIMTGDISEIISSFMILKRGMFILPLIFKKDLNQVEFLTNILNQFLNYLPINILYAFCLNEEPIEEVISSVLGENDTFIKSIILEDVQLRIAEWIINNQQKIFRELSERCVFQPPSNITGFDSKINHHIEWICISEGNFLNNTDYSTDYFFKNMIKKIASSQVPIFRAAISFSKDELEKKLHIIDPTCSQIYEKYRPNVSSRMKNMQINGDLLQKLNDLLPIIHDKIISQLKPQKIEILKINT